MSRTAEILLEFQPTILGTPVAPKNAFDQACSADKVTIDHWRSKWLENIRANKAAFGSFADHSIGKLWRKDAGAPSIVAGAGPSLKHVVGKLGERPENMQLVSCLHNFHYMEDNNANVDYYVTLDAGDITINEVVEGGKRDASEYWELTKDRTLLAYIGTSPELLGKWQGRVLFYNAPVPDKEFLDSVNEIEPFNVFVESGGNVLGTCLFIAKGFLNSQINIFVGADFSFSNEKKRRFHAWDSSYDETLGHTLSAVDIFGNRAVTWQSYYNFKLWFEVVAQRVPGLYINATEGGIFGAHREGNISAVRQMWLDDVFDMFNLSSHKMEQAFSPENPNETVFI